MRNTANRMIPRTMNEAFGHGPAYYDPFEHYVKPFYQRLSFWIMLILFGMLAATLWSAYA